MTDIEERIATALGAVVADSPGIEAVIVEQDDDIYVQACLNEHGLLYIEAVSNEFLPDGRKLSGDQMRQLVERGYSDEGGGNYWKEFHRDLAIPDEVAREIVETLTHVYGADAGELNLVEVT
jgi:hypothetical protein